MPLILNFTTDTGHSGNYWDIEEFSVARSSGVTRFSIKVALYKDRNAFQSDKAPMLRRQFSVPVSGLPQAARLRLRDLKVDIEDWLQANAAEFMGATQE